MESPIFEALKTIPKTKNPHESVWDHHGSYQWSYFNEEIKQRIESVTPETKSEPEKKNDSGE